MTFEDQLKALIFFHLHEHDSARHLIQELNKDEFAREFIAHDVGISMSNFSEAISHRGLEQLQHVFQELSRQSSMLIPKEFQELGDLIAIDGSLIDAVLTMYWADYRKGSKKVKGHFGFDINRGVPTKIYLTDGNGGERPFVSQILSALSDHSKQHFKKLFGRSLQLRQVSAGGCNACEADLNVLLTPFFDLGCFGINFVASPRHADGIVVTGPVSRNMKTALLKTYEAIPAPKVVIAVGSCALSGAALKYPKAWTPFYRSISLFRGVHHIR